MAAVGQQWVGKNLLRGGELASNLKLWWHPPENSPCQPGVPKQELFHRKFLSVDAKTPLEE